MKYLFGLLTNLLLISTSLAAGAPPKCPDPNQFQRVPMIIKKHAHDWYTLQVAKFGTNEKWSFIISRFDPQEPRDIVGKATSVVKSLAKLPEPIYETNDTWGTHWYCYYPNQLGYATFAKTYR